MYYYGLDMVQSFVLCGYWNKEVMFHLNKSLDSFYHQLFLSLHWLCLRLDADHVSVRNIFPRVYKCRAASVQHKHCPGAPSVGSELCCNTSLKLVRLLLEITRP